MQVVKTDSLETAAFLVTLGVPLAGYEEVVPGTFEFSFEDGRAGKLIDSFGSGGEAPARELFLSRRRLLSQIKSKQVSHRDPMGAI